MNPKLMTVIVCSLGLWFLAMSRMSHAEEIVTIPLRLYLQEVGTKLDCYFTVESVGRDKWHDNFVLDSALERRNVKDVEELSAFLTNAVGFVTTSAMLSNRIYLVVDRLNRTKPILRIRDKLIAQIQNYPLNRPVRLEYEGTSYSLIDRLTSICPLVRRETSFSIGSGPITIDPRTAVKVAVNETPIRDLLTDCIPLTNNSRILWSSYTNGKQDSPIVTVKYHGSPR